jgi:hypothetical protein
MKVFGGLNKIIHTFRLLTYRINSTDSNMATIEDEIEIKEEADPKLDEVDRLLSMLEEDANTEPVIDLPDFVLRRNESETDPLCTNNEFTIVPIEKIFPQEVTLEEDNKDNIPVIVSRLQ